MDDLIEKFHCRYLKYILGVNKYASNIACRGELGRFPLTNRAKSMTVKYWANLEKGTPNTFLNRAYKTIKSLNTEWLQSIHFSLEINGLSCLINNSVFESNHKIKEIFLNRLNDQYTQTWYNSISNSKRFKTLTDLYNGSYKMNNYLLKIHNPSFRKIFTRLRIDMNVLQDCLNRKNGSNNTNAPCPLCKQGNEDITHFIFDCPKEPCNSPDQKRPISPDIQYNARICKYG